jgi:hypothetical protein
MSDIKVLIVVDGIFSLTTTYPIDPSVSPFGPESNPKYGPDAWFTLSHLISTLRNSPSPTFTVDTASRGFNAAGNFPASITNSVPDPDATIPGPFHFDDPSVNLLDYDEIWLFSDEGYDGGQVGPIDPTTGEPGGLTASELTAITKFMEAGGGLFATGDHDGLGSAVGGRIPRVRYMRKWYSPSDTSTGKPPLTVTNWPGDGATRVDTLQQGATDVGDTFFFDDQSDDIPQPLTVLVPSHPAVQGATGVLSVYPDHMHEGEVIAPTGAQLTQTSTDTTLSFAGPGFTEFPSIGSYQQVPIILATSSAGTGGGLPGHVTEVPIGMNPEDVACENANFSADSSVCGVRTNNTLAAYDGSTVNRGRIITDSSFHHFLDLNLLGDPCSLIPTKKQGFNASTSGKAVLKELDAFFVNIASWLAGVDRKFYFGFGKNNYGRDEVLDNPNYPQAFYLFLEGFTPNVVGSSPSITFSGSFFTDIPGLTISGPKAVVYDVGNTGANANVSQRIRFEYEVQFTGASLSSPTAFPPPGSPTPNAYTLNPSINIQGKEFPGVSAEFFLLGGDDPYFTNINETAGNQPYLSQDLRVFTITPTANEQTPIGNVPFTFQSGSPTTFDHPAAYNYIQALITWLNQTYGYLNLNTSYTPPDTNVFDPLKTLLPQELTQNGDSSVTPNTGPNKNYNFAIARVRLKGSSGQMAAAPNVKVFFRLFTTQTFDTDFINSASAVTSADPQVTYLSDGSLTDPSFPQPGTLNGVVNGCSLPFFATGNYDDNPTDYNPGGVNNQTIEIPNGDYTWAFYGCYLNVNDATNQFDDPNHQPVQYWLAGAVHSCLVAQIAYSDAPIENENGVIENPENTDKLAQRNLQVTTSGNPGFPATHRVPQTIDVRPSPPAQSTDRFSLLSYPDEIMIDWGKTPLGSVASIYWPAVSAASVLQLAAQLYPAQTLSAADANTIQCKVVNPVTYIPIPAGTGGSFAGLLTVDLPASVRIGDEFDIVVRRITTRQVTKPRDAETAGTGARPAAHAPDAVVENPLVWRYATGSFLVKIPVQKESTILPVDENLLAILKWRLGLIGPGNRWYPVLLRYISYLSGRIDGMGGNASEIPPSPDGYQPPSTGPVEHAREHTYTGKVIGIRYDRFGDFEGFIILSENGHEHSFRGREHEMEEVLRRAWIERTRISVFVDSHDHDWPASIVLRQQK